ncbi:MAG: aminoacyl-tRNA hydrolase [Desulfovibrionaceae bacterium]|nr:aminoacyl-tRNA hydrolase [Desulfovibrionaceae bacterium]
MEYRGVLAGLGNPGPKYAGTRHNAGFMLVDRLLDIAHLDGEVSEQNGRRFNCELYRVSLKQLGGTWLFVKPLTFMNLSGEAVQPVLAWHKLAAKDLVVVHDELDLPPGSLRFKFGGGNAGHNGLKSITQQLGTPDFYRLRIGIGHPKDRGEVTGWVLNRMPEPQASMCADAIEACVDVLSAFARKGLESAVTEANKASRRIAALHEDEGGRP